MGQRERKLPSILLPLPGKKIKLILDAKMKQRLIKCVLKLINNPGAHTGFIAGYDTTCCRFHHFFQINPAIVEMKEKNKEKLIIVIQYNKN